MSRSRPRIYGLCVQTSRLHCRLIRVFTNFLAHEHLSIDLSGKRAATSCVAALSVLLDSVVEALVCARADGSCRDGLCNVDVECWTDCFKPPAAATHGFDSWPASIIVYAAIRPSAGTTDTAGMLSQSMRHGSAMKYAAKKIINIAGFRSHMSKSSSGSRVPGATEDVASFHAW